jgi:hypothetical protein
MYGIVVYIQEFMMSPEDLRKMFALPAEFDDYMPGGRTIDRYRYLYPGVNRPVPPLPKNMDSEEMRDAYGEVFRVAYEKTLETGRHHILVSPETVNRGLGQAAIDGFNEAKATGLIEVDRPEPQLVIDVLGEMFKPAI